MGGRRCKHTEHEMIAYWAKDARVHGASFWCPACGALGWTEYGSKLSDTKWRAPNRGRKPQPIEVSDGKRANRGRTRKAG